jgi:hypothetical protein
MIMQITMKDDALNIWRKVLSVCRASNYARIVVTFDGCGDSGHIEDMDFQFNDSMPPKHPATLSIGDFDVQEGFEHREGRWQPIVKRKELTLADALETVTYDILDANIPGWEINEGTSGTITYDIDTGAIRCEFNERLVNIVEGTFDFTDATEGV